MNGILALRRLRLALLLACLVFPAWPIASALANTTISHVDAASDHAATLAYHRFLSATVAPSRRADDAFVSSISTSCPNVLAAVNLLPAGSFSRSAVLAFGEEMAGDLTLAAVAPWHGPFAKLAAALRRLR